jgi:hypothetical protein
MADDLAAALARIRERHALAVTPDPDPVFFGSLFQIKSHLVRTDVPRLLAAVDAALKLADEWEADTIADDYAAQSAYNHCAGSLRAAITAALAAAQVTEAGDG